MIKETQGAPAAATKKFDADVKNTLDFTFKFNCMSVCVHSSPQMNRPEQDRQSTSS